VPGTIVVTANAFLEKMAPDVYDQSFRGATFVTEDWVAACVTQRKLVSCSEHYPAEFLKLFLADACPIHGQSQGQSQNLESEVQFTSAAVGADTKPGADEPEPPENTVPAAGAAARDAEDAQTLEALAPLAVAGTSSASDVLTPPTLSVPITRGYQQCVSTVLTPSTATPRARNDPAAAASSQGPPPPTRSGGTRKCEDCQETSSSFGLPDERSPRWCGGCARRHPGSLSSRGLPAALARVDRPSSEEKIGERGQSLLRRCTAAVVSAWPN
jgi:hypothetical protein